MGLIEQLKIVKKSALIFIILLYILTNKMNY